MKQRGSALIISMMLIATVGAAAFGIARLLYADTSIATTYENGTIAYYAAESGVEEGFLRYKYNMNAEVPYVSWAFNDTKVFRTNLAGNTVNNGTTGEGIGNTTSVSDLTRQIYDLRIGYLGTYDNAAKKYKPFFSHDAVYDSITNVNDIFNADYSTGDYSFLQIPKDEARTFDLSNIDFSANQLDVGLKFISVGNLVGSPKFVPSRECKAMAEVKFLINGGTALAKEYKALTSYNPGVCANVIGIEDSKLDAADAVFATGGYTTSSGHDANAVDNGYYYLLSNILTQVLNKAGATILGTDKVSMTIKPLYYATDISFTTSACKNSSVACISKHDDITAGPYTYISSTGYFGGTTRTLTANIDRQSGTLYDLYSYVLFKGN